MKMQEVQYLMSNRQAMRFQVLSKGFKPFETDDYNEALCVATRNALSSDYVSILDDGVRIHCWSYGKPYKPQIIR